MELIGTLLPKPVGFGSSSRSPQTQTLTAQVLNTQLEGPEWASLRAAFIVLLTFCGSCWIVESSCPAADVVNYRPSTGIQVDNSLCFTDNTAKVPTIKVGISIGLYTGRFVI